MLGWVQKRKGEVSDKIVSYLKHLFLTTHNTAFIRTFNEKFMKPWYHSVIAISFCFAYAGKFLTFSYELNTYWILAVAEGTSCMHIEKALLKSTC